MNLAVSTINYVNENAMSNRHMDFFKVDFELKDLLKNLNKTSKD